MCVRSNIGVKCTLATTLHHDIPPRFWSYMLPDALRLASVGAELAYTWQLTTF